MTNRSLSLRRDQILGFRRAAGSLDERSPSGAGSLRRAAWAGLQDSMPRAALLSIHARVAGTTPGTWEDPSLVQLWGPRFSAFVVAGRDLPVFSLGRYPTSRAGRRVAEETAEQLDAFLAGRRMGYGEAGAGLGLANANKLRYAAPTGRVLIQLGRRAAADDLDGATAGGRPARGSPRARPASPARVRPIDAGRVRHVGGDRPCRRTRGLRRPRRVPSAGPNTGRRRVDPRQ